MEITCTDVVGVPFKTATLQCTAIKLPNGQNVTMAWSHDGVVITNSSKHMITQEKHAGTLTVTDIRREDGGGYRCAIDSIEQTVLLFVRPYVHKLNSTLRSGEGGKFPLPCDAWGYEMPTVQWYRNATNGTATPVTPTSRIKLDANEFGVPNARLIFDPLSASDSSVYTCSATNGNGTYWRSTTLRVNWTFIWLVPLIILVAELLLVFICIGTSVLVSRKRVTDIETHRPSTTQRRSSASAVRHRTQRRASSIRDREMEHMTDQIEEETKELTENSELEKTTKA